MHTFLLYLSLKNNKNVKLSSVAGQNTFQMNFTDQLNGYEAWQYKELQKCIKRDVGCVVGLMRTVLLQGRPEQPWL
jgi:hypothetical protein